MEHDPRCENESIHAVPAGCIIPADGAPEKQDAPAFDHDNLDTATHARFVALGDVRKLSDSDLRHLWLHSYAGPTQNALNAELDRRFPSGCRMCGIDFPEAAVGGMHHRPGCWRAKLPLRDAPPLGKPKNINDALAEHSAPGPANEMATHLGGVKLHPEFAAKAREVLDALPKATPGQSVIVDSSGVPHAFTAEDRERMGRQWAEASRAPCVPCGARAGEPHRIMCPTQRAPEKQKEPAPTHWTGDGLAHVLVKSATPCGEPCPDTERGVCERMVGHPGAHHAVYPSGRTWAPGAGESTYDPHRLMTGEASPDGPPRLTGREAPTEPLYESRGCGVCGLSSCMHPRRPE